MCPKHGLCAFELLDVGRRLRKQALGRALLLKPDLLMQMRYETEVRRWRTTRRVERRRRCKDKTNRCRRTTVTAVILKDDLRPQHISYSDRERHDWASQITLSDSELIPGYSPCRGVMYRLSRPAPRSVIYEMSGALLHLLRRETREQLTVKLTRHYAVFTDCRNINLHLVNLCCLLPIEWSKK